MSRKRITQLFPFLLPLRQWQRKRVLLGPYPFLHGASARLNRTTKGYAVSRKRITQLFPFLLPLRQWQRKKLFYAAMRLDRNTYAHRVEDRRLPHVVHARTEAIINRASGHPIQYQHNKAHNLRLAAATLDGLVIGPGETFSFWQRVRDADRTVPFRDGLVLQDGRITGGYGGGLCQLSDLLLLLFLHSELQVTERHPHTTASFAPASPAEVLGVDATVSEGWLDLKVLLLLFLHSELQVTERHPHTTASFAPASPAEVLGVDATVSEGWLDLKAYNPSSASYQLAFSFDDEHITGTLRSSDPPPRRYELFNERCVYWHDADGRLHLSAAVGRRSMDPATGDVLDTQLLFETETLVGYTPAPGTPLSNGRPEPLSLHPHQHPASNQ